MHILIHTQYYPPEMGAPQARLSELARGLVARGNRVTVLTAMPNYPTGKVFPGYGGLMKIENQDGVRVIRTAIYPTKKTSFLPRLASYFSFVFSSLIFGLLFAGKPDYVLTESPPLFLGISGLILSRLKRARWIFNISDLWPESAVHLGVIDRQGLGFKFSAWLEAFCYRNAWSVTGQSRTILADIQERFPDVLTFLLSNGVDVELFHPNGIARRKLAHFGEKTVVLYAGLHGIAQGLEQVLLAGKELLEMRDLNIVMVGDGPEKEALVRQARNLKLENVHFWDPMPRTEISEVLSEADICVIPLKLFLPGAVPSKLYEAMGCGRPVVLVAEGEAAHIVESAGCGLIVRPGDTKGLASALVYLTQHPEERKRMGEAGRQAVVEFYNREKIIESFHQFLYSPIN